MYQAIATSVSKAATAFSDPYTGSVTKQITSEQSQQSSMTSRIGDWDTRLAAIQAQYTLQFNNLEIGAEQPQLPVQLPHRPDLRSDHQLPEQLRPCLLRTSPPRATSTTATPC